MMITTSKLNADEHSYYRNTQQIFHGNEFITINISNPLLFKGLITLIFVKPVYQSCLRWALSQAAFCVLRK